MKQISVIALMILDSIKSYLKCRWQFFLLLLYFSSGVLYTKAQYDTKALIHSGKNLIIKEKYYEAITKFNRAIYVKPYLFEPYFFRAYIKFQLQDYTGAKADFDKSIEINPYYAESFRFRGLTCGILKDYNRAILDFNTGIHLDTFNVYIYLNRAMMNADLNNFDMALTDCNSAIKIKPSLPETYLSRGTVYFMKKEYKLAEKDMTRAIQLNPNNDYAYIKRGLVYYYDKKTDKAIEDYNIAAKINPKLALIYFYRAIAQSEKKDFDAAFTDYDKALELEPDNTLAYFNRGVLNAELSAFNKAIDDYSQVLLRQPQHILSLFNRAGAYLNLNEYANAKIDYTSAIDLFPDFAPAYLNRSIANKELGFMAESEKDYRKGMELNEKYENDLNRDLLEKYKKSNRQFAKLFILDSDFEYYNSNKPASYRQQFANIDLIPFFKFTTDVENNKNSNLNYWFNILFNYENLINHLAFTRLPEKEAPFNISEEDLNDYDNSTQLLIVAIANQDLMNFNSAIENFDKIIETDSSFMAAWYSRAMLELEIDAFLNQNNPTPQIISLNNSLNKVKNKVISSKADLALARHDLKMAIQLNPEFYLSYYGMGYLDCIEGKLDDAILNYKKTTDLSPEFAEAWFNSGLIKVYQQRTKEGCSDLSKAGELGIKDAYFVIKKHCKQN